MNNDLISRAEAIDIIRSMTISLGGKEIFHPEAKKSVVGALDEIAAVDAEPVRHGRWDEREAEKPPILRCVMCSECGTMYQRRHKAYLSYCPNCGAKMDGDTT